LSRIKRRGEDQPPTSHSPASATLAESKAPPWDFAIVSNQNYPELYAGAIAYARENGRGLSTAAIRCPGHFPPVNSFAGILASLTVESYLDWVVARNCPVVHVLTSPLDLPPLWPKVACDYEAAGRIGARHFLELGNLNLAFYRYFDSSGFNECHKGFVVELEAQGRAFHEIGPCRSYDEGQQFNVTRQQRVDWLKTQLPSLPRPLAVMADDDLYAIDVALAARQLGLKIPEDVAILGVDDYPILLGAVPEAISSIDVNFHEVGRIGSELLHRMLEGAQPGSDEVPMLVKVPPKGVVVRSSTVTFQCDHPGVTAAAIFVRQHFHESISVSDVAAHAKMSVRALQVNYPQRVGRTVKDDILCQRLKRAQTILENSDLKLAAVAMESGLGTLENLCRVFQANHRMTPLAWRMEHRRI
jgi:LacI family transcriptional regulator